MKVSILIPCYNEHDTIKELLERTHAVALGPWEREVIVVDDGSSDGSREILESYRGRQNNTVLFHDRNQGKGTALATALTVATGDYVVVLDADLELVPEEIPVLLSRAAAGADAVYGTRNTRKENLHPDKIAAAGVWLLTKLTNFLYGTRLTDVWNGFKLVRRTLLEATPFPAGGFESEVLFTAALASRGVRIEEVPVSYFPRTKGLKKITYGDGLRTLALLLGYRLRGGARWLSFLRWVFPRSPAERLAFFGTLVASLIFFGVANLVNGSKIYTEGVGFDYPVLAQNIFSHGLFSEDLTAPFRPGSTRTPLYPAVLGIMWLVTGKSWFGAYMGMQVLNAFLSLAFFRFAAAFLRTTSAALFATAIFALEPVRPYVAMSLYSEILLLLLLFIGFIFVHRFIETRQPRFVYAAALLWGATLLARPVTGVLGILLALVAYAGMTQWRSIGRKCVVAFLTLIIFSAPSIPWLARNRALFGQAMLSSLPEHQLAGVIVPYFMAWKAPCAGCGREQSITWWRDTIAREITSRSPTGYASRAHVELTDAPTVRAVALPYIKNNLFSFTRFMLPQVALYPFLDSWRSILHNVFGVAPKAQFPISFPARLAQGDLSVLSETLTLGRDRTLYVFIVGKLVAVALVLTAVVGLIALWRRRTAPRALVLLLVAQFLFFSALAVPTYEARYRVYIVPFLALFAAAALFRVWRKRDVT